MIAALTSCFQDRFGGSPDAIARAPGRVNLIGEHTDYNDGFVLPAAIGVHSLVAIRRRHDTRIKVVALDYGNDEDSFDSAAPIAPVAKGWANYVRGTVAALLGAGYGLFGAEIAVCGNVPQGAGLSSSAALEVALIKAFDAIGGIGIDATRVAQIAQRAECDFVGTQCGIMDQLISSRGEAGHALLIDCRSLGTTPIPLPETLAIMIVHSGISRGLVDGEYNMRRKQCEAVAAHFGIGALRDLTAAQLDAGQGGLDPLAYRRARHVVTENARTLAAAAALRANDLHTLGTLMAASHASMRDDFEITLPAIDALVALLAQNIGNQGGARMTGGGFGGACVALLPRSETERVAKVVSAHYRAPDGSPPLIMLETASAGATIL